MSGGVDEPEESEQEQGSLALLLPGDEHTQVDWEHSAAAVLRRAGRLSADDPDRLVWRRLTHSTLDDIDVTPLGTPAMLEGVDTSGRPARTGGWDVRVEVEGGDADAANTEALADLDGGASSLWLRLGPGDDLDTLLDGVLLDIAPVVLDAPEDPVAAAEGFLAVLGDTTPATGTNLGVPATAPHDVLIAVAEKARSAGVLGVVVDATIVHDRGASDAQELGWSMAVAAQVLRTLTASGIPVGEAARLVEFRYAATDEQFPTIAKLRSARRLWARILELSEAEPVAQRQHVVTSRPMMTAYDPWVNMLRTTVAAFAAGVGGADAVTVLPFDSPLGRPDAFGRRIARNTSAVLVEESHLGRVADPAGGAYAVERLTHDLAAAAWAELGRIEETGFPALDDRIAEVVAVRDEQVATRSRPLTGLTEFPHLNEDRPGRVPSDNWVGVRSYGAGFEALRDQPPEAHVFLATMGPIAAHTARAGFAANLFAAGGVEVDLAGPAAGVDDLLAAYDRQPVACLAGNDAAYAAWGREAVAALRAAGARRIIVAGVATGSTTGLFDEVDDSCKVGGNALPFLHRTREALK